MAPLQRYQLIFPVTLLFEYLSRLSSDLYEICRIGSDHSMY